jgi:hypothetical protein
VAQIAIAATSARIAKGGKAASAPMKFPVAIATTRDSGTRRNPATASLA